MEKARAACLSCDRIEHGGAFGLGHGGVSSIDAMGEKLLLREALRPDRSPRGQVTTLPPDVEERTAELYRRWCGLDTIDALLLLHVCNGGTTADFGAYLLRVHGAIERANVERDNYRATAWAKWKRLVARFAPYMRGERLQSWDDGHGGAIRKERERDERQPDLFDFMGGE